jgi:AmmeMemoRadiSam system protein B/AmmeMemoRadiSam system protein A
MCKVKIIIKNLKFLRAILLLLFFITDYRLPITNYRLLAQDIKQPNVSGTFYPANPEELSVMIDAFIDAVNPQAIEGEIFALISPHAGYGYSGKTAAYGYKLIKDKPYKTVVIIGPSHRGFNGVSIYKEGIFRTPLGDLEIDKEFTQKLLNKDPDILFVSEAFEKEHSVEVQLPFLQKVLSNFSATERGGPTKHYGWKIVPIVMGDCSLLTCKKMAALLKEAIGDRKDVLVIASTDMKHSYDYEEVEIIDNLTLSYLEKMDFEGLYYGFRENKLEMCGMFPVVTTIILAKESGHNKLKILFHTNSAEVTGKKVKGAWTVGYTSCVIDQEKARLSEGGERDMLNKEERKKILEIARKSIENYLKTEKKLEIIETDAQLLKEMGAFVTLHKHGDLRGCIGNLIVRTPLYLTIRDMAIESAVGDPRFPAVGLSELKDIEIEISVLSPLEKIDDVEKIELGRHGVLIRKGFRSGVFLPQVAIETGWSKEEFLSYLCARKAGLEPFAWKDKSTEIYIFTAEVFSEKSY